MTETATKERTGAGERIDAPPAGALERYDPHAALHGGQDPLLDRVSARMLAVLKGKWRGLNDAEVAQALEVAASVGLNPWTGEIHAGKSRGKDGEEGRLLIMVGRDGLLRKAEEFPDYQGYDAGVVYDGDVFRRVAPNPEGVTMRERAGIIHETPGFPEGGRKILGAWACAERRGRPTRTFIARWDEYAPSPSAKVPWNKTSSAMMEKVPVSMVHRTLINLSGVYLEEEVQHVLGPGDYEELPPEAEVPLQWGEGPEADRLRAAWERIEQADPAAWPRPKMEMSLPGLSPEGRVALAETIEREAEEAEARNAAEMERTMAEEAAAEAEPAEAEVVAEPETVGGEPAARDASDGMEGAEEPPQPVTSEEAGAHRPYADTQSEDLRARLEEVRGLLKRKDEEGFDDDPIALDMEREDIERELAVRGGEDPGQGSLLS